MRKDYDEPIRWDRWGFRNPAACFETLPSSRGGVSKHATETTEKGGTGECIGGYDSEGKQRAALPTDVKELWV